MSISCWASEKRPVGFTENPYGGGWECLWLSLVMIYEYGVVIAVTYTSECIFQTMEEVREVEHRIKSTAESDPLAGEK